MKAHPWITPRAMATNAFAELPGVTLATLQSREQRAGVAPSFCDRHPRYSFALLTILYLAVVASLSSFKLLWFDELVTLHIARLGSAVAIWRALAHAADPNPPLAHFAVSVCRAMFGEHEWALRLPATMGYWLGMVSLFVFLRRRLSGTWALAGTLLSMTNAGFDFSFESRSYGIFYGLTMLALLCWSRFVAPETSSRRRLAFLAGMTMALALAISANYFAVLAFLPIACGEFVRCRRRSQSQPHETMSLLRSTDLRIWAALMLALTPILAYKSLIMRSVAQYSPHAFNKVSASQIIGSYTEMIEYILYPLIALFCLALTIRFFARSFNDRRFVVRPRWLESLISHEAKLGTPAFPAHEIAAALVLVIYPFLGYGMAKVYGGMFSPRLVVPVCFGFAILGVAAAFRCFGHLCQAGTILLAFLLAWFVSREAFVGYTYKEQRQSFYRVVHAMPVDYTAGPIVISDPLMSLTFQHYVPAALAGRIVVPIDFPAIHQFRGDDSPEKNLWAGRDTVYHLPIVTVEELQRSSVHYLILAADGNWLIEMLRSNNYSVDRLPIRTEADHIGGFTPLAHGVPAFFVAAGDRGSSGSLAIIETSRFNTAEHRIRWPFKVFGTVQRLSAVHFLWISQVRGPRMPDGRSGESAR